MLDDSMAIWIATGLGIFFEVPSEKMPTLIHLTQLSLIFCGLATISAGLTFWCKLQGRRP